MSPAKSSYLFRKKIFTRIYSQVQRETQRENICQHSGNIFRNSRCAVYLLSVKTDRRVMLVAAMLEAASGLAPEFYPSFTQVNKRCLGKTEKNLIKHPFFLLNKTVLSIG